MALFEKHGMSNTPEYYAWSGAKDRCFNPNTQQWHCYGGRGISMCDRWKYSFMHFYEDMGPRPSDQHSIDRIDNDGNYEPDNCRWATVEEQVYNRSTNRMIELPDGRIVTTAEAMELLDLKKGTLFSRLNKGTPLDTPIREIVKKYRYKGKIMTLGQLASYSDVPISTLSGRLAGGMDIEKALTMSKQTPVKYNYLGEKLTIPEIGLKENVPAYLIRYHMNKVKNGEYQLSGIVEYIKRYYTKKVTSNGTIVLEKPNLFVRHGLTNTDIHRLWVNLKAKCYQIKHPDYQYFGAKGCTICDEWKTNFLKFLEEIGERPSENHYFLVIDKSKPISPDNWRWTTDMSEIRQTHDSKVSKIFDNPKDTIKKLIEKTGLRKSTIYDRLARGVSLDTLKRGQYLWEGQIRSAEELSRISKVPLKTLKKRITRGWPLEKVMDPNLTPGVSRIKNNLTRAKKL